ncbi:hypothetical protein [Actinoallomurus sp. CA-150999]|uniref:hypothetical protein n=1 Tax=Actinoallomurus sp. CA-150999 TaxID=3239887 RepID=UPI003D8DE6A2
MAVGYDAHFASWAKSGRGFGELSHTLASAVDVLVSELAAVGAAWGNDDIGQAWLKGSEGSPGFGAARDGCLDALEDAVNLVRATGGMLMVAGQQYQLAESASTVGADVPKGADHGARAVGDPYKRDRPGFDRAVGEFDELPGWVQQGLFFLEMLVGGCQWPDGDMAGLARMQSALSACADAVGQAAGELDDHAGAVTSLNAGEAADKFKTFAQALSGGGEFGGLRFLEGTLQGLASAVEGLAAQKRAARLQFEISCAFVVVTMLMGFAWSWITAGASEAAAIGASEAEGFALKTFLQRIAVWAGQHQVLSAAAVGAWFGAGMDAAGQYARIHEGVQKGWNWGEFGKSVAMGAVAGGVMGVAGRAVARQANPLTTKLADWMAAPGMKGVGARFGFAGTTGTAGNLAGQAIFDPDHMNVGQAAAFGFGMAGLGGAKELGQHMAGRFRGGDDGPPPPPGGGSPSDPQAPQNKVINHDDNPPPPPPPGGGGGRPEPGTAGGSAGHTLPSGGTTDSGGTTGTGPHGTALAGSHDTPTGGGTGHAFDTGGQGRPIAGGNDGNAGGDVGGASGSDRGQATPPQAGPVVLPPRPGDTGPSAARPNEPTGSKITEILNGDGRTGRQPGLTPGHPEGTTGNAPRPGEAGTGSGKGPRPGETGSGTRPDDGPTALAGNEHPMPRTEGQSRPADNAVPSPHNDHGPATAPSADASPAEHGARLEGPHADGVGTSAAPHHVHSTRSPDLNPDTRPPLIGAHGERESSALGGTHAHTLTSADAARASQWAHLRTSAEPTPVIRQRHPYEAASQVDLRRIGITMPDGSVRMVSEYTVKVRYQADPRMSPEDVLRAKSNAMDAVDLFYNHQHRLPDGARPEDGSQLHVRLEFEHAPDLPPGEVVQLKPGHGTAGGERANMLRWYADMDPVVLAHEIGHHLDLVDEYASPQSADRRTLTAQGTHRDASMMGSAQTFWADHAVVLDHNGHPVPETVGLRDRHLAQIHGLTDRTFPPVHGEAREGVPGEPRAMPDRANGPLQVPDHVRDLLGRVDEEGRPVFPPEGRSDLEHARLLDRMHAVFGDHLPTERMTAAELRHTEALADAARTVYETAPDHSFRGEDLQRLNHLADVLGARPGDVLPRADSINELARQTLGREPTPREIDGLARLAERLNNEMGGRRAGESPVEALHRASGDLLAAEHGHAAARDAVHMLTDHAEKGLAPPAARPDEAARPEPPAIREIKAKGRAPDSHIRATEEQIDRWNRLADGELASQIAHIKGRSDLSVPEKLEQVRELLKDSGEKPSRVPNLDRKNLRVYTHQRGELFIHTAALLADRGTTIEIAYQPNRTYNNYRYEARASHLMHLDAVPEGMTTEQANAVAAWHGMRGEPTRGHSPEQLINDLVDLHAQPLRDALAIRDRLINDHGVDPERVVLAHDGKGRRGPYAESRFVRATLHALDPVRATPVETRQAIVDSIRGSGERGQIRENRAREVAEGLYGRHENDGPRKYAMLWVRDSRMEAVGGRHGPHLDTRPEFVRQTIETLRRMDPDRQILLLGDDLFARRPELRAAWERDGVLDGVDADSLVRYWDADRHDLSYGEQALFFHHFNAERDVIQIGMESGALEIPAVLGTPTVYFEAREYSGNKGERWQLYWDEWQYTNAPGPGGGEAANAGGDRPVFGTPGSEPTTFRGVDAPLEAPLRTMRRVLFGPELPESGSERVRAVAVEQPAAVSMTSDRINRLTQGGELDNLPDRLGRSNSVGDREWRPWNADDWRQSHYFADQLQRWIHTDATTPESAARKWEAINVALNRLLDPGYDGRLDPSNTDVALDDPYTGMHSDLPGDPETGRRLAEAYDAPPDERGHAVTDVIRDLVDDPEFRRRAVDDIRLFRLDEGEIHDLEQAIGDALAGRNVPEIKPFDPGRSDHPADEPPHGPRDEPRHGPRDEPPTADGPGHDEPVQPTHGDHIDESAASHSVRDADSLRRSVESGVKEDLTQPLGGKDAWSTDHVWFEDGTDGVRKRGDIEMMDQEELVSITGQAIKAPVAAAFRKNAQEVYLEFLDGRLASVAHPGIEVMPKRLRQYQDTLGGRLLGVLDKITGNMERNSNGWMVRDDGTPVGFDHSRASFSDEVPNTRFHPFLSTLIEKTGAGPARWLPNDFHPADIALLKEQVQSVRPHFVERDRVEWHDHMLRELDEIGRHAKGKTPLLAGAADHAGSPGDQPGGGDTAGPLNTQAARPHADEPPAADGPDPQPNDADRPHAATTDPHGQRGHEPTERRSATEPYDGSSEPLARPTTDTRPTPGGSRDDARLLEEGRRVAADVFVLNPSDPELRALARMNRILDADAQHDMSVAHGLTDVATSVGLSDLSVGDLARLFDDAQAQGFDPAGAADRAGLVEALNRHRAADPHLWDGLALVDELQGLPSLGDRSNAILRTLGEIDGILGSVRGEFRYGMRDDPLLSLSNDLGVGTSLDVLARLFDDARAHRGSAMATDRDSLPAALDTHRRSDPRLWEGLVIADRLRIASPSDSVARALSRMDEIYGSGTRSDDHVAGEALMDLGAQTGAGGRLAESFATAFVEADKQGLDPARAADGQEFEAVLSRLAASDPTFWNGLVAAERLTLSHADGDTTRTLGRIDEIVGVDPHLRGDRAPAVDQLLRLADDLGLGYSHERLLRMFEEAQSHGLRPAEATDRDALIATLDRLREIDPLWDGIRIAERYGAEELSDSAARALGEMARIVGSEPGSRPFVVDPLARLAEDVGADYSIGRLAEMFTDAQQRGYAPETATARAELADVLVRSQESMHTEPSAHAPADRSSDAAAGSLTDLTDSTSPVPGDPSTDTAATDARDAVQASRIAADADAQRAREEVSLLTRYGAADLEREMATDRLRSLEARADAWGRWPDEPEVSYTKNHEAFQRDYLRAVSLAERGEQAIPYMYENATGGLGSRNGGRAFGLELEISGPAISRPMLEAIARDLHAHGLALDADVHDYHSAQSAGYSDAGNTWRVELDDSVAGEIVSPILYDEPATWHAIAKICEVVQSHGGKVDFSTGGHIHISTHDYDHIVENHHSVLNMTDSYMDTLFRLAQNPDAYRHRGMTYCRPNDQLTSGYASIGQVVTPNDGHGLAVNMSGMKSGKATDHIEFRMWDGSLDPAVIQTRVKLSLGITEAAFRLANGLLPPNGGLRDPLGSHLDQRRLGVYPEKPQDIGPAESLSFRRMMDDIFHRTIDKEQATALFAITRWTLGA